MIGLNKIELSVNKAPWAGLAKLEINTWEWGEPDRRRFERFSKKIEKSSFEGRFGPH
ncbi:MAG TPA: hypothetical protein VFF07_12090 [Actinomycetota bacterium]|nr:hypothetical protein [Actinomycetota bacterium]